MNTTKTVAEHLVDYLERYDPQVRAYPQILTALVEKGLAYYREFVLPHKKLRAPTDEERGLLAEIHRRLEASDSTDEAELQAIPFDVAREAGVEPRQLFQTIYQVLLGQERGPRFGSFVLLLGRQRVLELLAERVGAPAVAGDD